jgi:hypothetical protein
MTRTDHKHLRIVASKPESQPTQEQLAFAFGPLIVLANVTNVPEQDFLRLLTLVSPDTIVDLRVIPRFDFGRLNRKLAFRLFADIPAQYHDLPCDLGISDRHHASLNPVFLADPINALLRRHPHPQRVVLLLDDPKTLASSLQVLPTRLTASQHGASRWSLRDFAEL